MTLHPLVDAFLQDRLPAAAAGALVGGSLPVPPRDLLQALAHAEGLGDPLRAAALACLAELPPALLREALREPLEPPRPLGLILRHHRDPGVLEAALLNGALDAAQLEASVAALPGGVLDLVLNNQVLWLASPRILDLLETHPEAPYAIKRRVNEFRCEVLGQISVEEKDERLGLIDEVEAGRLDVAWSELPVAEVAPASPAPAPFLSVAQRVARLSVNQRLILALRGGKEERTLLIRDSHRLVQLQVVQNARLSEAEVTTIAQSRSVHEDVLRALAGQRAWLRRYPLVKALTLNPRTPIPVGLGLLKRLLERDLRELAKSRDVSEALRREARRLLEQREKGRG